MNSTSIDGPMARRTLEWVTHPFFIYFFLVMALLGSGLFIIGFLSGGLDGLDDVKLPDATVMLFVGLGAFILFFPWFLCLYLCRILLRAIRDLEAKENRPSPLNPERAG
jgi:TRAP-type C4-dicarboxylate transport system permease small subunit